MEGRTTTEALPPPARTAFLSAALIGPILVLCAMAVTLFAPQVLNDADTFWHLATGEWILDHGAVPHRDPFSHSMPGAPWQPHEWLTNIAMALAFRLGGWSGLVVFFSLFVAATVGLIAWQAGRRLSGLPLLLTLILSFACMAPSLLIRPHLAALTVTVVWAIGMMSARERGRAPSLWFAGVMALWANMHGSYVFGFVLLAPFALEALFEARDRDDRRKALIGWGAFGVLSVAATALTPHGIQGVVYPIKLMAMTTLDGIVEWRSADFTTIGPFEIALLVTLFVCLRFGVKIPLFRLLLLLFLLHMALRHGRHLIILAAVAPLILAEPIARAVGSAPTPRASRVVLATAAAVALLMIGVRFGIPISRTDADVVPATALSRVPAELRAQPVLNDYNFGGYLISNGVKVFIDGRTDMYGDAFAARYFALHAGQEPALDEVLGAYPIAWTIFAPSHPAVAHLDRRGWRRLHADQTAVVHVRP